jgi:cytochrome c biogenesis protein
MRFYNVISSMSAGLILLALIGILSAIGSSVSDAFFRTNVFRFLLLLFLVNICLCTYNRLCRFVKSRNAICAKPGLLVRSIGSIILHGGIILILLGAGVYSWLGETAQLSLLQGDTADIGNIIPTKPPFSLKLTDFTIAYNDDGSPSQYYSKLEISEAGKVVRRQTISVNHPLVHSGVKAYQSSYGYVADTLIEEGNSKETRLAEDGDFITFQTTPRTVRIYKYYPNFDKKLGLESKSLKPHNPKIVYSVYEDTKLLGVGAASLQERIKIDDNVFIAFRQVRPYTVLTLKSDPGLPLAAIGGLFMMLGICITIFVPSKSKGTPQVETED